MSPALVMTWFTHGVVQGGAATANRDVMPGQVRVGELQLKIVGRGTLEMKP